MDTNNLYHCSTFPVELSNQILEEAWCLPLSTTEHRDLFVTLRLVCTSFRWIASRLFLQDVHVVSLAPSKPRICCRFYDDATDFRATFFTVVRPPTPPPMPCVAVAGASPSTSMTRPHLPTSYICTAPLQTPPPRRSTQYYSPSPATPHSHPRYAASHFTTPVGPSRTSSSTHA
jgi:hypothetical protein